MSISLTETQKQRLRELDADITWAEKVFQDAQERDESFKAMEKELVEEERQRANDLRLSHRRPSVYQIERALADRLVEEGFVQVSTPIIISKDSLEKMTITDSCPLTSQVFWQGKNKCLRPMLAPNLYQMMRRLGRLWPKPIRIFEAGPCFRKDTQGSEHLNEFTMLNLVEMGLPLESRKERLTELIGIVMNTVGIDNYRVVSDHCDVYGETTDVLSQSGTELCSAAMGPHPLDDAWSIFDPWVGIGMGLERLAMIKQGYKNIQRTARSLIYLDGVRLNI